MSYSSIYKIAICKLGITYYKCCDYYFDSKFKIVTRGRIVNEVRSSYFDYLPSYYSELSHMLKKLNLKESDCFVDFGSGLGRAIILAAHNGCGLSIGVEIDDKMVEFSRKNITSYKKSSKVESKILVRNEKAEQFHIEPEMNYFYFYNPFHVKHFIRVIRNILESYYMVKRTLTIILCDPLNSYVEYMSSLEEFTLVYEMKCKLIGGGENGFKIYQTNI